MSWMSVWVKACLTLSWSPAPLFTFTIVWDLHGMGEYAIHSNSIKKLVWMKCLVTSFELAALKN
jgi:hypothetical protein